MKLRPYQETTIDNARDALSDHRSIVLALPTGAGKTVIANSIIQRHRASYPDGHIWFVVDRVVLVKQTEREFDGLRCQILQGENTEFDALADVTIATVQTLASRWNHTFVTDPTLIIIDECHVLHSAHFEMRERHPDAFIVGMTATPLNPSMGKLFDTIVHGPSISELMPEYLVKPRYYVPANPDLTGIETTYINGTPDYVQKQLGKRMCSIVGDVVQSWMKLANGLKTVVFACDIAHAETLTGEFTMNGISCRAIHSKSEDRDEALAQFANGEVTVLVNVNVLTAGFDHPDIRCIVLARPTKSLGMHIQQLGRGLRTSEGKDEVLVIDHAGNIDRHGRAEHYEPPTELNEAELKERATSRSSNDEAGTPCDECGFLIERGHYECPECGYSWSPPPRVTTVDGSIIELDSGEEVITGISPERFYQQALRHFENDPKCIEKNFANATDDFNYFRQRAYLSTKTFCKDKGYQMPANRTLNALYSVETSEVVRGQIKHQQIRYVKGRNR